MNENEQVKEHFERGKVLRRRRRYVDACAEFQKAAEIAPANADLLVEWGLSLSGKGDFAGSVEKYRKALEVDSTRGNVYVLWGRALSALKQYAESVKTFTKAIVVDPGNIDAYLGVAEALCAQDKWKEAIEAYKKVIEHDPAQNVYSELTVALEKLRPGEKAKTLKHLEARLTSAARYAIALTCWGDEYAAREMYDDAVRQYRKACQVDPIFARAYISWGNALHQQRQYVKALRVYLKAIKLGPEDFWSIKNFEDAIANLNEEESAAATKRLDKALRSNAKNARFYCAWGDSLASAEHYPEAIKCYQDALQLDPKLVDALLGCGDVWVAQRNYVKAVEHYSHAIQIDPAAATAYRKWAGVLSSQKEYSKAAERYQQVIEKNLASVDFPELLELLANLDSDKKAQTLQVLENALAQSASAGNYVFWGDALSEKERYTEAITKYEKAVQLDEKAHDAWNRLGKAQVSLKDYSKAMGSYRRMIELDPYDGSAYFSWAYAFFEQKQYAEAAEKYRQAAELMPDPEVACFNQGQALLNQRKYTEAIECYKKALDFDPNYVDAHLAWAKSLYRQQKYVEAITQYEKAFEKKPDDASAHYLCGLAFDARRMYDEAIEHYKKALDLEPKNADPYLDWGSALNAQGRLEEAIKVCEQGTKINEDFVYAYHNIAYYLGVQGDYKACRKAWERASQVYERKKQEEKKKGNADFFHYYGGGLYEYAWNPEKSEQVLQEGLAIDPDHTGILSSLLELYLDRHDEPSYSAEIDAKKPSTYGKARECFGKAERILKVRLEQYEDPSTLQDLGHLYLKMGECDEAKIYLEKALKQEPDSSVPNVSLGVVCSRKEDYRQAAQYFEAARRRDRYDLNAWSNLAEVYLKVDPKKVKQIEKAEAEFRHILKIAPEYIDAQIGLGEVYTAIAETGEKDFFEVAIKHYGQAIQLAEYGQGSKRLKTRALAAVHYSRGYAAVKLYEASRPFGDEALLSQGLEDFQRCAALDPDHCKAMLARDKLDKRLNKVTRRWLSEKVGPWLVLAPSLFVLFMTQLAFIFNIPQLKPPIDVTSYIALTFGSLIFVVIGLFLPEIQKLKGAGIELEKGAVTQISTSGSIGISK